MRDEKFLNGCLMDSDGEAKIRARRRRGRALATALAVEAIVVVGLALWPMITPGSAPGEIVMLPRIPYQSSDTVKQIPVHQSGRAPRLHRADAILFQPLRIPPRIDKSNSATVESIAPPVFAESGPGVPADVSGVPHGTGNDASMIPRPAGPTRPQMIRRSEGVQSGMLVYRIDPRYPRLAVSARISGTVELRAIIGRDGRVRSVQVLSGNPLLTHAAVAAVREWRYRPTLLNGAAVEVETLITVRFVLGQ
ncbi:MAG TPA: energy transducer TonB [Candidatus Acidoferrales bacterium]|nr:energy transducer TonB [Candidatus Acidoferrales bacterium]